MTSFGKFTLRFAAYGVIVLYLACDLLVFQGPLYKRLQANKLDSAESIAESERRGVVALVYGQEITLAQIDHAIRQRLSYEGLPTLESLPSEQLQLHRYAALSERIDHELLRVKATHSASEIQVEPGEIEDALARIRARFPEDATFQRSLADLGDTEEAFRNRLAARIQQSKFTNSRIDPLASSSDPLARHQAAREFRESLRQFETNRNRIHIRHEVMKRTPHPPQQTTD